MITKSVINTVCFFTIATKDDGITQLIYITIISTVDHFEAYCLAFMPGKKEIQFGFEHI